MNLVLIRRNNRDGTSGIIGAVDISKTRLSVAKIEALLDDWEKLTRLEEPVSGFQEWLEETTGVKLVDFNIADVTT